MKSCEIAVTLSCPSSLTKLRIKHGTRLWRSLQISSQYLVHMLIPYLTQEVSLSWRNCRKITDSLCCVITICQLLCLHTTCITRFAMLLNWLCLCALSFLTALRNV